MPKPKRSLQDSDMETATTDLWAEPPAPRFKASLLANAPYLKPRAMDIPSARPAAEVPYAGLSYHPSQPAYDEVVKRTCKILTRQDYAQKAIDKKLSFPKSLANLKTDEATDEGWSEEDLPGEPPVKKIGFFQAKKLNEKVQKAVDKAIAVTRKVKEQEFNRDVNRACVIMAELQEKKKTKEIRKEQRDKRISAAKPFRTKQTGEVRFQQDAPPVLPPDALTGNLRTQEVLYYGTNPILDRFQSFQKRNIVPTRKLIKEMPKKRKLVTYYVQDKFDADE